MRWQLTLIFCSDCGFSLANFGPEWWLTIGDLLSGVVFRGKQFVQIIHGRNFLQRTISVGLASWPYQLRCSLDFQDSKGVNLAKVALCDLHWSNSASLLVGAAKLSTRVTECDQTLIRGISEHSNVRRRVGLVWEYFPFIAYNLFVISLTDLVITKSYY